MLGSVRARRQHIARETGQPPRALSDEAGAVHLGRALMHYSNDLVEHALVIAIDFGPPHFSVVGALAGADHPAEGSLGVDNGLHPHYLGLVVLVVLVQHQVVARGGLLVPVGYTVERHLIYINGCLCR